MYTILIPRYLFDIYRGKLCKFDIFVYWTWKEDKSEAFRVFLYLFPFRSYIIQWTLTLLTVHWCFGFDNAQYKFFLITWVEKMATLGFVSYKAKQIMLLIWKVFVESESLNPFSKIKHTKVLNCRAAQCHKIVAKPSVFGISQAKANCGTSKGRLKVDGIAINFMKLPSRRQIVYTVLSIMQLMSVQLVTFCRL